MPDGFKTAMRSIGGVVGKKIFGPHRTYSALKDISFTLREGEMLGVIGKNGSGKSTLMQCMAGIFRPTSGVVRSKINPFLLAGVGTGYSASLTGKENLMLYGSMLGLTEERVNELMPEMVEFSELESFIDEPMKTYSSGMKARLGITGLASFKPDVLLIDEVLGVGDPTFKEKSQKLIMDMIENASTVMMASQSFNLLKKMCDRIIMLEKGEIVALGDPSDVIDVFHGRKDPSEVSPEKRDECE
ncbi:MAG: ABC transporter ATP-binding protein [Candidatus Marinimicrobia bacterium]|jgi:ABC-type polysaccharide/polyol phosphate transport system ATPase subunit|nr:ABC transporter ATP-binding protein [Candidatus Neomarinimicrobiota bacterium]